jgi:hypothetical protein
MSANLFAVTWRWKLLPRETCHCLRGLPHLKHSRRVDRIPQLLIDRQKIFHNMSGINVGNFFG